METAEVEIDGEKISTTEMGKILEQNLLEFTLHIPYPVQAPIITVPGFYSCSSWLHECSRKFYNCSCYYAIAVPGSIIAVSSYMVAVMNSIVTAAKYIVAVASFIVAAAGFTVAAGNYEVGGRLFENEAGRLVISLASYRLYDGQLLTGHHPSKRDGTYLLVLGA